MAAYKTAAHCQTLANALDDETYYLMRAEEVARAIAEAMLATADALKQADSMRIDADEFDEMHAKYLARIGEAHFSTAV